MVQGLVGSDWLLNAVLLLLEEKYHRSHETCENCAYHYSCLGAGSFGGPRKVLLEERTPAAARPVRNERPPRRRRRCST